MSDQSLMGLEDIDEEDISSISPSGPRTSHSMHLISNPDKKTVQPTQLFLLTVEYAHELEENGKFNRLLAKGTGNLMSEVVVLNSQQINLIQPTLNTPYSNLQYIPSILKDANCQGQKNNEVENKHLSTSAQPQLLVLKGQVESNKTSVLFSKGSSPKSFLHNDVVIAPLPETVVNVDLTNEVAKEPLTDLAPTSEIFHAQIDITPKKNETSLKNANDETNESTIEGGDKNLEMNNLWAMTPQSEVILPSETLPMLRDSDLICKDVENSYSLPEDVQLPGNICDVDWDSDSSLEGSHVWQVIADKPVTCRAKASLPAKFLYFDKINGADEETLGVFARKEIPKRTQFGPVEGMLFVDEISESSENVMLLIEKEGGEMQRLDVSNKHLSNWMGYVRPAKTAKEQNLILLQQGESLYYTTTRKVAEHEELKVWYSIAYATARGLPLLIDTNKIQQAESNNWTCQKCYAKFPSASELKLHISSHNGLTKEENIVKPKYNLRNSRVRNNKCDLDFNSHLQPKEKIRTASKSVNEEMDSCKDKNWYCSHCQREFSTATLLNLHMLTHAADNLETFDATSSVSDDPYNQSPEDDGSKTEQENKPLNCNICFKRFYTNSALACHVKSHSDEKKFQCPICEKVFDKVLGLKTHIHSHSTNGYFSCSHCSKKFLIYKHIRKHIRTFHSARTHACDTCSKRFPTLDKLRMHELSHSDHRQFLCANCGKQFKRKDKLSEHMKKSHYPDKEKTPPTQRAKHQKKFIPKMLGNISDYTHFIYKCHICIVGFKRRGMLVNHLANRHPDIAPESVPELNLPILKATKDYFCQHCDKIYKSSSKRKAHILKNHPGAELPLSNRQMQASVKGTTSQENENGTYSQTVGSVTTNPQGCPWCHKQYASKAKLLQHQRKKHANLLPEALQKPRRSASNVVSDEMDTMRCDEIGKVGEGNMLLHEQLNNDMSEYEISEGDGHCFAEGEFIIDAPILKRALKGEMISADCSPESIAELGQLIADSRPDQYFKVIQTSSGITFAQPVEIWDPLSSCQSLSPSDLDNSPFLTSAR